MSAELFHELIDCDISGLRRYVRRGGNVNIRGGLHNKSLLHFAACEGHNRKVRFLIQHGMSPDCRDDVGQTPLFDAIIENRPSTVRILIALGADPGARDSTNLTPLHCCAIVHKRYAAQCAEYLLEAGASPRVRENVDGDTPLHQAVRGDNWRVARVLLAHGAYVNAKNAEGKTPLELVDQPLVPTRDRVSGRAAVRAEQKWRAILGKKARRSAESRHEQRERTIL